MFPKQKKNPRKMPVKWFICNPGEDTTEDEAMGSPNLVMSQIGRNDRKGKLVSWPISH